MAEIRINCNRPAPDNLQFPSWNDLQNNGTVSNPVQTDNLTSSITATAFSWGTVTDVGVIGSDNFWPEGIWRSGFINTIHPFETPRIEITGLTPGNEYVFTIYSSTRINGTNGFYRLVGDTTTDAVQIAAQFNTGNNPGDNANVGVAADSLGKIVLECIEDNNQGSFYSFINSFIMTGDFPLVPQIINIDGDDTIFPGQTNVDISVTSGASAATAVQLLSGSVTVNQSFSAPDDTTLTINAISQGDLAYDGMTLRVITGGVNYDRQITMVSTGNFSYAVLGKFFYENNSPILSLVDNAPGESVETGDQIEINDPTGRITVLPDATITDSGSTAFTFQARRWSILRELWGDYETFSVAESGTSQGASLLLTSRGLYRGFSRGFSRG